MKKVDIPFQATISFKNIEIKNGYFKNTNKHYVLEGVIENNEIKEINIVLDFKISETVERLTNRIQSVIDEDRVLKNKIKDE